MSLPENKTVVLYAAGDIGPCRKDPHTIFNHVRNPIQKADAAFCQLEPNISLKGSRLPQARLAMRTDPKAAAAIKKAGFNVVSFASNHCLDWGYDAFFDTLGHLNSEGIHVIGAGKDLAEARKPAMINCKGARIAFLAYNTILPQGYWAEPDRPGCAPLRAMTVYEQIEHDQPGTPPRIHTYPHRGDLDAMTADVMAAGESADVVIVSMHWGLHFIPAQLADYQRDMARTAIDAGADIILGHHAHILKGIEIYKGKIIFYSLANFALDPPGAFEEGLYASDRHKEVENLSTGWNTQDEYPLPHDTRKTLIAKCIIQDKGLVRVSFLPVYINTRSEPEILLAGDERFQEVIRYMEIITQDQHLNAQYAIDGNEVIVSGPGI